MVALAARMQLVLQPHALQGVNGTGACCARAGKRSLHMCCCAHAHTCVAAPEGSAAAGTAHYIVFCLFVCSACCTLEHMRGGAGESSATLSRVIRAGDGRRVTERYTGTAATNSREILICAPRIVQYSTVSTVTSVAGRHKCTVQRYSPLRGYTGT